MTWFPVNFGTQEKPFIGTQVSKMFPVNFGTQDKPLIGTCYQLPANGWNKTFEIIFDNRDNFFWKTRFF